MAAAATGSPPDIAVGAYVLIDGLQSGKQHNGRYGFVTSREDKRLAVVTAHHDAALKVKPSNLTVIPQNRHEKCHEAILFYPNPDGSATNATQMLVTAGDASPLKGWPTDWTKEMKFLREQMGFRNPVTVTGVTRIDIPKADLVFYFDAGSDSSIANHHAMVTLKKLPKWEVDKVEREIPKTGIKGVAILVFSPTESMATFGSTLCDDRVTTESGVQTQPSGGKLSLDDAAEALAYQHARRKKTNEQDQTDVIAELMQMGHLS